jgi:hypothetical protein
MGRIYTRAGLGLKVGKPIVHYGVFGTGLFQTIYSAPQVWWPLMVLSLEWWFVALSVLGLAPVFHSANALVRAGILGRVALSPFANPLVVVPAVMLALSLGVAWAIAGQASPPPGQRRWWSRLLIAAMHVVQPVARGWARYKSRFETHVIPESFHALRRAWRDRAPRLLGRRQIGLWSEDQTSREKLLETLLQMTAQQRWFVHVDPGWESHDVRLYGDKWCQTDLVTVTENHGGGRRLTRIRLLPRATFFQKVLWIAIAYVLLVAVGLGQEELLLVSPVLLGLLAWVSASGRRLNAVVVASVLDAAEHLGMTVVGEPDAFKEPSAIERPPLPAPGCPTTARSISPLVRRAAGLHPPARRSTTR